jgi:hypothetical protein
MISELKRILKEADQIKEDEMGGVCSKPGE